MRCCSAYNRMRPRYRRCNFSDSSSVFSATLPARLYHFRFSLGRTFVAWIAFSAADTRIESVLILVQLFALYGTVTEKQFKRLLVYGSVRWKGTYGSSFWSFINQSEKLIMAKNNALSSEFERRLVVIQIFRAERTRIFCSDSIACVTATYEKPKKRLSWSNPQDPQ